MEAATDKLMDELRDVVAAAEDLLKATTGERMESLRSTPAETAEPATRIASAVPLAHTGMPEPQIPCSPPSRRA